jgi:hypothetical protein
METIVSSWQGSEIEILGLRWNWAWFAASCIGQIYLGWNVSFSQFPCDFATQKSWKGTPEVLSHWSIINFISHVYMIICQADRKSYRYMSRTSCLNFKQLALLNGRLWPIHGTCYGTIFFSEGAMNHFSKRVFPFSTVNMSSSLSLN